LISLDFSKKKNKDVESFEQEIRMKNLIISVYKSKSEVKPESIVTIPFATLNIAINLLPKRVKMALEKEGIDLRPCKDMVKEKDLLGTIIEIENPIEKMVISVD